MKSTYQARKPVKVGEGWRAPGDLVPEAATWFRVDHLVHSGFLTHTMLEDEAWEAAVQQYCPDLHEILTALNKESPVQDIAAKRAYEDRILLATDPRRALVTRHAAPPMTTDPSRSDAEAAASLRAASLEAQASEIAGKAQEKLSEVRRQAAQTSLETDEIEVEGASEEFVSDNVERDEESEEYERKLRERTRTVEAEGEGDDSGLSETPPRRAGGKGKDKDQRTSETQREQARREQAQREQAQSQSDSARVGNPSKSS